jgi:ubiquinone/menaquinone biosynthesis C-methylase UbiE
VAEEGQQVRKDWRSYDPIAETYARVAEGNYFVKPAAELLSLLDPVPGSRFLDIGTGTGVVAALAVDLVGPGGLVVGLDPAVEMLRGLRKRSSAEAVVGELPNLPHRDESFDAIAAAFVLTHVSDHFASARKPTRSRSFAGLRVV